MRIYECHPDVLAEHPVITEYSVYRLFSDNPDLLDANYLAAPWVSLINREQLSSVPLDRIHGGFTVCQHAEYKTIIPILKRIGIDTLYATHYDGKDEDLRVFPFPHYSINGTAPAKDKDILYSFIGLDSTAIREMTLRRTILSMQHPPGTVVRERSLWHFGREVFGHEISEQEQDSQKEEYQDVLARSRFSLCLRGFGPNTIRFWESLEAGAIPVLLADTMQLPQGIDWEQCILRIPEDKVLDIPRVIETVSGALEETMRQNCYKAYRQFSGPNFIKTICDTYPQ